MDSPRVSVVIPCYNAEKYLRQCLDSVVNQTLREIEIICVDDGSSDATMKILREFQAKDSRVKVLSQENAGAGAARNNGLRQAAGEYLSFLDADDFFEPTMLEEAAAAADQYQADYVVFNSNRYHMDTEAFAEVPWVIRKEDIPPYMPFSYRQLTGNVFLSFVGWAWDKLYRRSFVLDHDLWFQEQRTTNDALFVFSALVTAKRIAVVDKVLAHQRRGSAESLSVTREKSWHCFYDALTALKERLIRENIFWELEQDYINYALHFCLWHLNSLAEPTHTLLENKLREEWFEALGISDKPEKYFYSHNEYARYKQIMGSHRNPESASKSVPRPTAHALPENMEPSSPLEFYLRFDSVRDQLMEDSAQWEACQWGYWKTKYSCFLHIHSRLDDTQARPFYIRMCRELKRAMQLGQLRKEDYSEEDWNTIQSMIIGLEGRLGRFTSLPLIRKISHLIPMSVKKRAVKCLRIVLGKTERYAAHD